MSAWARVANRNAQGEIRGGPSGSVPPKGGNETAKDVSECKAVPSTTFREETQQQSGSFLKVVLGVPLEANGNVRPR